MALFKNRSISLVDLNDFLEGRRLEEILSSEAGVQRVQMDFGQSRYSVAYNLEETNLAAIESVIIREGFRLNDSFFHRLKRKWLHYIEENESENARIKAAPFCSNPEKIMRKGKKMSHTL